MQAPWVVSRASGRMMQTFRTVTEDFESPGKMHARPNRSGIRATITSPGWRRGNRSPASCLPRTDRMTYATLAGARSDDDTAFALTNASVAN